MPATGEILSVKLKHDQGTITCDRHKQQCNAFWGCACNPKSTNTRLDIIITDGKSNKVFPGHKLAGVPGTLWYTLPNQLNEEQSLTFPNLTQPLTVRTGDSFIVWYSSHLLDRDMSWKENAAGTVCFDVVVLYSKVENFEPF